MHFSYRDDGGCADQQRNFKKTTTPKRAYWYRKRFCFSLGR